MGLEDAKFNSPDWSGEMKLQSMLIGVMLMFLIDWLHLVNIEVNILRSQMLQIMKIVGTLPMPLSSKNSPQRMGFGSLVFWGWRYSQH